MRSSKISSLIVGAVMAYGVVGVSTPAVSLAQPMQVTIPETSDTLNGPSQTDTTAGGQMVYRADQQNLDPSVDAEIDHRFNELRSELLDDRASTINWWLAVIGLVLTFFAIAVPILGLLGYRRFKEIEKEAQESAKEAKHLVEEIKQIRDKSDELLKGTIAKNVAGNPAIAQQAVGVSKEVARAISLQKEGKIEEAITRWKGIAYDTEEIDNERAARAWLSVSYLEGVGENFEGMLLACDKAIRLKPDFTEAYYNRGIAKEGLGQYQDAIADFDEAIRLKPNFAEAHHSRGIAKAGLGQHQDAIADFDEAIRLNPNFAEAYHGRGNTKADLGEYQAAIVDYDEAIRLKPDDAAAYNDRGAAYAKLDRVAEARTDFEKARKLAKKAGDDKVFSLVEKNLRKLKNTENA